MARVRGPYLRRACGTLTAGTGTGTNAEDAKVSQKSQKKNFKDFFLLFLRLLRNLCAFCVRLPAPVQATNLQSDATVRVSMLRPRLRWSSISAAQPSMRG